MAKMTFDKHTSAQFNAELESARNHLMHMGGLVEQQLELGIKSLIEVDSSLAEKAITMDKDVNDMELKIDEECTQILARRNPAASDLRFIISVTKAVNDIERIGDESAKIAKQAMEISNNGNGPQSFVEIRHIAEKVRQMVHEALDAFARLDTDLALSILQQDKAVDLEYGTAIRTLVTHMMEDPRTISHALNVMWALRSLERIGDHARNIGESVIYLVKGKDVRHRKLSDVADELK